MGTTHLLRASAMLAAALAGMPVAVHGQAYPAKPIRFVIPFSPGGAADVPGRIIGEFAKWAKVVKETGVAAN